MANNRTFQVQLQLNTDAAKKSLTELTDATRKALSPNTSTSTFIKENQALDQMNAKLKMLVGVQSQLANQKGMSVEFGKVSGEIASILSAMKKMATGEEAYLAILKAETAERKNAASIKQPSSNSGNGLGGIGSGASQVFGATGLPGGGLIGATGPLGLLTTASTQLAKVFNDMGEKAKNTASIISDSGGKYDQLTQAVIKHKQAEDRLADDPVFASFAKFKTDLETAGLDILKGAIDKFAQVVNSLPIVGKSQDQQDAEAKKQIDAEKARTTKLKGQLGVDYENIKHDRVSMEKEIAMSEQEFAVETQRKKRDLALETTKFELDAARKGADLQKQLARENQAYAIEKQKLTQDQAFKTSQAKFAIDQAFEQRAFQQKIADENQTFQQKQNDARQDYQLQQSFKAQDLQKELGRGNRDFSNRLVDMGISGAGGMEYLQAARDRRNQVSDKLEDYDIEKQRAGLQFGIQQGREGRDFGIQQGREGRDFGQSREKTVKEHLLDVEQHRYELGMQQLELDIKHNQALEDSTTNLERLAQDTAIGRQELANKKSDLTQDTQMTRNKMDFDESEKRRSQNQKEMDFGGNLASQLPAGDLQDLMKSNPELAQWIKGDSARKGTPVPTAGKSIVSGLSASDTALQMALLAQPEKIAEFAKTEHGRIKLHELGIDGYADGGRTGGNGGHLAILHPGEYIINPNATDKKRQLDLLMSAGQKLGKLPSFDGGGYSDWGSVSGGGADWNAPKGSGINNGSGGPADDYAGRFAAFASSLTHASNAEANQAGLSSGAAFGGAGLVGANGTRGVNQHGNPYASATPGSYLSLLQQQQNQAANPPPSPAPIQTAPIQMPGNGGGNYQPVQIDMGNDQFHFNGTDPGQIEQQIRQVVDAKVRNAMSQYQSAMFGSMQRYTQGGRQ